MSARGPTMLQGPVKQIRLNIIPGLSKVTMLFLRGKYTDAAGWNNRLFHAACDMAGNNIYEAIATPLLLAGAGPRTDADMEKAVATIQSAFAVTRHPARSYHPKNSTSENGPRTIILLDNQK